VNRNSNAKRLRHAALGAAIVFLLLQPGKGLGQRNGAPPPRPRFAAPRVNAAQQRREQRLERREQRQLQNRPQAGEAQPRTPADRAPGPTPSYPNANYGNEATRPGFPAAGARRPANTYPGAAPPGHLGDWLNKHSNLPAQDQERLLRNDPNFNRLPQGQQQRLIQQLHELDQMPEQQRERRLARAEAIEHLSPQDRMNLNRSNRDFAALMPDRQAMVKRAFQDLRSVPLDQRQTVLNSARYQGQFSPEERGILSNFLRVEPYEPPR
jgi:hypothetical protein